MAEVIPRSKIRAHADAGLSQMQIEALASRLANKRDELAAGVVELEKQIVARDDCSLLDTADAASLQENRLRAHSMLEQDRQVIEEFDTALHRLGNGHYGINEITGEPIGYASISSRSDSRKAIRCSAVSWRSWIFLLTAFPSCNAVFPARTSLTPVGIG